MSDDKKTQSDQGEPVSDDVASQEKLTDALGRAKSGDLATPSAPDHADPIAKDVDPLETTDMSDPSFHPDALAQVETGVDPTAIATGATLPAASPIEETPTEVAPSLPEISADLPQNVEPEVLTVRADHPMAPLYVQAPALPDIRGNRGAGAWIVLLATLGFAIVYAGVISAILAPITTASAFVGVLQDHLLTPMFFASVGSFFIGLLVVVLLVNRAGWWAYVLFGFLIGAFVYCAAVIGLIYSGGLTGLTPDQSWGRLDEFLLSPFTILAGVAGREVSVWFGAWIAARGRKIKRANAEEIAEYETRLQASPLADIPAP